MNIFKKFLKNKIIQNPDQKPLDRTTDNRELHEKLVKIINQCTPIQFIYEGMDEDQGLIFLKGEVDGGEIGIEFPFNSSANEIESKIKSIYFDYGYIREKLSSCYAELVFKRFYKDFGAYYHFEFTNGEEQIEIQYHLHLGNAKESVYTHISTKQNVLLGILKDTGSNQFQIDNFDVVAFLKTNHGKKVEIKVV